MVRVIPGASDPAFVERCRRFLLTQLRLIRPSVVLVLGVEIAHHLVPLAPERLSGWRSRSYRTLDADGAQVVADLRFEGIPPFTAVALVGPSARGVNLRHRSFAGRIGHDAEVAMIHTALANVDSTTARDRVRFECDLASFQTLESFQLLRHEEGRRRYRAITTRMDGVVTEEDVWFTSSGWRIRDATYGSRGDS